ncbi:kinase family protein [Planoprotostelium fungivorum]|uniref:Kinase family protein n=1 Tax=Planoprotostelium fungivorum TaxID=1890364 RepID=A0A2P6NR38_9EUKA|nr:kinase family protein [Planoprotostelium fungivorum]
MDKLVRAVRLIYGYGGNPVGSEAGSSFDLPSASTAARQVSNAMDEVKHNDPSTHVRLYTSIASLLEMLAKGINQRMSSRPAVCEAVTELFDKVVCLNLEFHEPPGLNATGDLRYALQRVILAAATKDVHESKFTNGGLPMKQYVVPFVSGLMEVMATAEQPQRYWAEKSRDIDINELPSMLSSAAKQVLNMDFNATLSNNFMIFTTHTRDFLYLVLDMASTSAPDLQGQIITQIKALYNELIPMAALLEQLDRGTRTRNVVTVLFVEKKKKMMACMVKLLSTAKVCVEVKRVPCERCKNLIFGNFMVAAGKKFCQSCFTCAECKKPLNNYVIVNGEYYCDEHGQAMVFDCSACKQRISGQMMKIGDRRWHSACFRCAVCDEKIDTTYYEVGSDIRCFRHMNTPAGTRFSSNLSNSQYDPQRRPASVYVDGAEFGDAGLFYSPRGSPNNSQIYSTRSSDGLKSNGSSPIQSPTNTRKSTTPVIMRQIHRHNSMSMEKSPYIEQHPSEKKGGSFLDIRRDDSPGAKRLSIPVMSSRSVDQFTPIDKAVSLDSSVVSSPQPAKGPGSGGNSLANSGTSSLANSGSNSLVNSGNESKRKSAVPDLSGLTLAQLGVPANLPKNDNNMYGGVQLPDYGHVKLPTPAPKQGIDYGSIRMPNSPSGGSSIDYGSIQMPSSNNAADGVSGHTRELNSRALQINYGSISFNNQNARNDDNTPKPIRRFNPSPFNSGSSFIGEKLIVISKFDGFSWVIRCHGGFIDDCLAGTTEGWRICVMDDPYSGAEAKETARSVQGTWRSTSVAIKLCNAHLSAKAKEDFLAEARVMMKMRPSPHVVQLLGICMDNDTYAIVLEYLGGGSLEAYLNKTKGLLPEKKIFKLAKSIARGVLHIHHENLIHRDLAARNILLTKAKEPKLADFGFSRIIGQDSLETKTSTNMGPIKWMSPECLTNMSYSRASDVWSYGIILWEIIAKDRPHREMDIIDAAIQIRAGLSPPIPDHTPAFFKQLLPRLWHIDPAKRPNIDEVCAMFP